MRIVTSAPTRIDFAGGTLDIWPLYLFHPGAQTVNAAISLRARAAVETRSDDRVVIHSLDTGATVEADHWQKLRDSRQLRLLALLCHFFEARGITLTTSSESPAGAGIAGSSALNVAVCAALAEWNRTVEAQAIAVPTGVQDYRPALFGGVAAVELDVDGVRRVPLEVDPAELDRRLVLCYTGEPRNSGTNNWEIMKKHIDGDRHVVDCFDRIRDAAAAMRDGLTRADWAAVGRAMADEWDTRKRLAPGVSTPVIDQLIDQATRAGADGAKVCGAGGGGCLVCIGPPERRDAIRASLTAGGARLLDVRIEQHGLTRG
ncbi:MAG: GHMP kinase [Acidobacteria bacterium]|nr:GHMP kinase [Acidobacteriota bacterium]